MTCYFYVSLRDNIIYNQFKTLYANSSSAEHIKAKVIDYLISILTTDFVVGNEVMYGTERKVVDLLLLLNKSLIAIEIKGEKDNLLRLEKQLIEYKKNFNGIIICTTNTHHTKIRKIVNNEVGLLLYSEGEIREVRKPIMRKRLDKKEILSSIPSVYLKQIAKSKINALNSDEVREYYLNFPLYKIQDIYYTYMSQRLKDNFALFIQERGQESHIDDIPLLSIQSTNIQSNSPLL